MVSPFAPLSWAVATVLISIEWINYTHACIRQNKVVCFLYHFFILLFFAPLFLLYAIFVLSFEFIGAFCCTEKPAALELGSVAAPPHLRVASYNIQSCVGMDVKYNIERTARTILRLADPVTKLPVHLIAIQEIEGNQLQQLQHLTGMKHGVFVQTRGNVGLRADSSIQLTKDEEDDGYGIAVLSRFPILEERIIRYPKWQWRSARACVFVRVEPVPGEYVWFGCTHLQNDLTGCENSQQLRLLAKNLPAPSGRVIVGMDSNLPAFRLQKMCTQVGFVDATCLHPSTFPAESPFIKLDALLSVHQLEVQEVQEVQEKKGMPLEKEGGKRVCIVVGTMDEQLSETASLDTLEGKTSHASDHRPVVGSVYLL